MHVPEGNAKEPMVSVEAVTCETSFVEKTALDKLDGSRAVEMQTDTVGKSAM